MPTTTGYAQAVSQSGAGTPWSALSSAQGAPNNVGSTTTIGLAGTSNLLTHDFAQVTGTIEALTGTLRVKASSNNAVVVLALYDGATLLGTTAAMTLTGNGAFADKAFSGSDFILSGSPLDLTASPRTNPAFHITALYTSVLGSGLEEDAITLLASSPPTIVSATVDAGGESSTLTFSEEVSGAEDAFNFTRDGDSLGGQGSASFGPSTTHSFPHDPVPAGDPTVQVNATGGAFTSSATGLPNDAVSDVPVTNPPAAPVAAFTYTPHSGLTPLTVAFTDTSTGTPTSWDWDWGDGKAHGTTQNPSHQYTINGTFTVTLTATNAGGSDTETHDVVVSLGDTRRSTRMTRMSRTNR